MTDGPVDAMRKHLSLTYLLSFAVLGATVPYLALTLQGRGLSGFGLAVAVGMLPAGRLIAGPLWTLAADRLAAPRGVLRIAAVVAVLGAGAVAWAPAWWSAGAVALLSLGRAALSPIVDALALDALRSDRPAYGRVRRWGSLGFMGAAALAGAMADHVGVPPLVTAFGFGVCVVVVVWTLPLTRPPPPTPLGPAVRQVSADRGLRWVLVACALHFSAHVGSTSFLAVHMAALGLSTSWVGAALSVGVLVEILVMSQSRWIFARWSPGTVLMFAMGLGVLRWVITALVTDGVVLVLLQALHGITFGAFWLAAVSLVDGRMPAGLRASGQGLLAAAVGGLGALLGMSGASFIVDALPTAWLFWLGAVVGVGGLLGATVGLWLWRREARVG